MESLKKILSFISVFLLVFYQAAFPLVIFALEATPSASEEQILEPTPEPSPSPTPNPEPTIEPSLWTESNGAFTTQTLQLGITYKFPPNEKVSLNFTKLPEGSGTVTVREHDVPETVENAGSKDYEITSNMPNGSFSFDLTLPTNDPNKEVLTSQDGQNYDPVSNETVTSSDTVTIKGITHLTHFIVAVETANFNHPLINEFFADGSDEWVEIYNPRNQEENITGWNIYDSNLADGTPFVFPEGSVVPAKGFLAVDLTDIVLNDTGDTVNLVHNGEVIDSRAYDEAPPLLSIGRSVDGGPDWTTFESPYTREVSNGTTLDTLYVDDDWNSPENDGDHTWGFDAFATIADAINFAPEGSTINVAEGTYDESITIGKSLTLTGAGSSVSTINGCEDVVTISAGNVTVEAFTLTDNDCGGGSIVYIGSVLQNININDNVIEYGYNGIYTDGSANTIIQNNEIRNNTYGVYLTGDVGGSQITDNNIHDNEESISASGASFNELQISDNEITNSSDGYGIYFNGFSGGELTISQNQIVSGSSTAIYLAGGGGQISDSTVSISGNTISANSGDGIYADVIVNSTFNILNNTIGEDEESGFSGNTGNGIYVCAEGYCQESEVIISGNIVSANGNHGIYLYDTDDTSAVTIGENNTISGNTNAGIFLADGVTNTTITGNIIENNGVGGGEGESTGIVVQSASGNEAHENIISANGSVGVQNNDGTNIFDATLNFWGSETGPEGEGNNTVSANVIFRPFYTDGEKNTLSTFEAPEGEFDPDSLFSNGIFSLPEGITDQTSTTSVTINEEATFSVSAGGGTSSVLLPSGTVITKVGGGAIDATLLSTDDVSVSTLSGFTSGIVAQGAFQWGIPDLGLEFNQAITLSIFVGTDLNGQTLNVVRSTNGSGDWISTGIVDPGTCVVTAGLCTFQATRASYFAATQTSSISTSTSSTQALSPAGGGGTAPVCNDQKPGSAPTLVSAVAGTNSVTLNWNKALNPVTYYLATYGLSAGTQQYGNPNIGGPDASSYTVSGLSGATTYYFKVRAGNGCTPGDFSNEVSATPGGGFVESPATGFEPGVLGAATDLENVGVGEENTQISPIPQPQETETPPFDAKVLLIVVMALLFGFGIFKLIIK